MKQNIEIVHGICELLQFDEIGDNEQMVQGLAVAMHQILKDGLLFLLRCLR